MIYRFLPLILFCIFSFKPLNTIEGTKNEVNATDPKLIAANTKATIEAKSKSFYSFIDANGYSLPSFESFAAAFEGYEQLKQQGKIENEILTIVDFSLSSTQERMWVVDMKTQKVILKSLVAHGRNSGSEYATDFSNANESFKSSLGFYVTGEVYNGKHGLSLRLDGMEYGINDNARNRAVVVHGADYVSKSFIKNTGRLGRSQGCPAVPYELHKELIETIKGKSCIFIYHPSRTYVAKSKLVS
ncbi:murein L,D-transpeptidase catalytic domain family protein [Flavobacterium lacisediminis]|uniref:Murein L,D-transpeptidase catalytic domain family protein n=1 Tax=Flavobacterium lacisediminis TaxID=2989705 RepID=A0ABT3EF95_9FLAO|nr:murein L,D-transpeptidase catalytic domain family protein [Flavobacterium lacisediminis]MCW1147253.1 murein L,D-transpeptidase catalytic domain family protein [Flavobacterium lacisediminis]